MLLARRAQGTAACHSDSSWRVRHGALVRTMQACGCMSDGVSACAVSNPPCSWSADWQGWQLKLLQGTRPGCCRAGEQKGCQTMSVQIGTCGVNFPFAVDGQVELTKSYKRGSFL